MLYVFKCFSPGTYPELIELGNPLTYEVTAGNINDCVSGYEILELRMSKARTSSLTVDMDIYKIITLLEEKEGIT